MSRVTAEAVPEGALLAGHFGTGGHYTDAFRAKVPGRVTLGDFLTAFYTSPLFRAERLVLRMMGHRSTDADAAALAAGADRFAAWRVTDRRADEILLGDVSGATSSWFRVVPEGEATTLWFGSAVCARRDATLRPAIRAFVPLHRLYSRALLASARRRLS